MDTYGRAFDHLRETFEEWKEKVDKQFEKRVGLSSDDWPDQDYYGMFEDGQSPLEAVAMAVENEYGDYGLETFGLEDIL